MPKSSEVFWGTAIVLFLLKWIDLNDPIKQGFWVEVTSQIENGEPDERAFFKVMWFDQSPYTFRSSVHSHWNCMFSVPCGSVAANLILGPHSMAHR